MSKRSVYSLHLTPEQARKVLRAIEGPSVTDPVLAHVYRALKDALPGKPAISFVALQEPDVRKETTR